MIKPKDLFIPSDEYVKLGGLKPAAATPKPNWKPEPGKVRP